MASTSLRGIKETMQAEPRKHTDFFKVLNETSVSCHFAPDALLPSRPQFPHLCTGSHDLQPHEPMTRVDGIRC